MLKHNGIEVSYMDGRSIRGGAMRNLRELKPDALLYSAFSNTLCDYVEFDRLAKQLVPGVISVIGGPGPTYSPQALDGSTINALCVGEGDHSLVGFLQKGFANYGNIRLIGDKGPAPELLPLARPSELPFPDRDLVYQVDTLLRDMPSKQFFSGRGCPYDCTYCFNHSFRDMFRKAGPAVRKKSVDYLLEEIRRVRASYCLASVVFNDDLFIVNKPWLMEFCEKYPREIGLPYTCNIRANLIDEEVARALHNSGCRGVSWSIESGDAKIRSQILGRHMTDEQILAAANLLNKYLIQHRIGNVVGLPGETREQMLKTLEINIRAKPNLAVANIFMPFPGLRLTQYAISHGYYTPHDRLPRSFYERSVLNFSSEDNCWLQKLMLLFSVFVRYPWLYRLRWIRWLLFALPRLVLRLLRESVYTVSMMRLHVVQTPLKQKIRLAWRYFGL